MVLAIHEVTGELQHGRRRVGGDDTVPCRGQLLGKQPGAAAELQYEPTTSTNGYEQVYDPGRAQRGVEREPTMVDNGKVMAVVRTRRTGHLTMLAYDPTLTDQFPPSQAAPA